MIVSAGQTLSITGFPSASFGDEIPLLAGGSYYPRTHIELVGQWLAYGEMYRTQPWVHTLVKKVAVSGARLPILVHERSDDGSRPPIHNSPFGDLLERPSSILDPKQFWIWVMSTFELYGEAILWKWRDQNGQPRELFPLHPTNVNIRRLSDGTLEYDYMPGSRHGSLIPPIPASDVLHFKSYNPQTSARGLSWLEPLRQTLLTDDASRRAQAAQWRNGARPSVVIEAPNALSDQALTRVATAWKSLHSGVDNWAKTVILEEGMKVNPFQITNVDMQYIAARQLAREECCAVADIPPPVVHVLDHATFTNIVEQMRSMYRDTMTPRLALYESVIDHQLRPDFDPGAGLRAAFDMGEVLTGSPEQQTESDAKAIMSGQLTPNEVRSRRHLGPHPDGNRLFINSALIPLGTADEAAPSGTDVNVVPQRVKSADVRPVLRKLGHLSGYVQKAVVLDKAPADLVAALAEVPEIVTVDNFREAVKALELESA